MRDGIWPSRTMTRPSASSARIFSSVNRQLRSYPWNSQRTSPSRREQRGQSVKPAVLVLAVVRRDGLLLLWDVPRVERPLLRLRVVQDAVARATPLARIVLGQRPRPSDLVPKEHLAEDLVEEHPQRT